MSNNIDTTKNKAKLWNECMTRNYFKNIPDALLPSVQKKFEESVALFVNQDVSNNSFDFINEQILEHFNNELMSFTSFDKQSMIDDRKNEFEKRLQEKQAEFDMMMNQNKPNEIDFTQQADEPLKGNIDDLINKHTEERNNQLKTVFSEQNVNDNLSNAENSENNIIAPSYISNTNEIPQQQLIQPPIQHNLESTNELLSKIELLEDKINKQNVLLNNLTRSQIQILNLLKR